MKTESKSIIKTEQRRSLGQFVENEPESYFRKSSATFQTLTFENHSPAATTATGFYPKSTNKME
jgi:hypothetical protein